VIKYLGSKRTILPLILDEVRRADASIAGGGVRTVLDLFSGTSRVGHALKRAGFRVLANDHNAYALALARCYVQADAQDVLEDARRLLAELGTLPGSPGYFTSTFCEQARYVHPSNGERIDAIREAIARKALPPELEAVLLVSLMEAADRVDSTTGLQMAYLKSWAPRALNRLELRVPDVLPRSTHGKSGAHSLDALDAARSLEADLVYVDPPYNQHSYLGNYHVWETLVLNDQPDTYGKANKRIDVRTRPSVFNQKRSAREALAELIGSLRCRYLLLSFNDEGYVSLPEIEAMLGAWGEFQATAIPYRRYVGASIGIHNREGEKVGQVSHLHNHEWLFVAKRSR